MTTGGFPRALKCRGWDLSQKHFIFVRQLQNSWRYQWWLALLFLDSTLRIWTNSHPSHCHSSSVVITSQPTCQCSLWPQRSWHRLLQINLHTHTGHTSHWCTDAFYQRTNNYSPPGSVEPWHNSWGGNDGVTRFNVFRWWGISTALLESDPNAVVEVHRKFMSF